MCHYIEGWGSWKPNIIYQMNTPFSPLLDTLCVELWNSELLKVFTSILWKPAIVLLSGSKEALQSQKETKHTVAIHIWLGLLWRKVLKLFHHLSRKPLTSRDPVTVIKQLHLVKIQLSTKDTFPALFCGFPFPIVTNTRVSVSASLSVFFVNHSTITTGPYKVRGDKYCTVFVIYNINGYHFCWYKT